MLTRMQTGKNPAFSPALARRSTIDPQDPEPPHLHHCCDDVEYAYDYLEGRLRGGV